LPRAGLQLQLRSLRTIRAAFGFNKLLAGSLLGPRFSTSSAGFLLLHEGRLHPLLLPNERIVELRSESTEWWMSGVSVIKRSYSLDKMSHDQSQCSLDWADLH